MEKTSTDKQRAFETMLDIDASPEEVWRALTEAEELMRWFPLKARVEPGEGGRMVWQWEDSWEWESRIDVWEPGRRLRLVQDDYRPSEDVAPSSVAMEFTLETHAGKTRVRLVHSGFGRGAAWDNELDSISEGWPSELRSLRLYLERHRGRDRQVGKATLSLAMTPGELWDRITGPGGFRLSPAAPEAGHPFEVTTPGGERFRGMVEASLPRRSLTGVLPELDNALFRIAVWRDPAGKSGVWLWLATYTGDTEPARGFEREAREALQRMFPEAAATASTGA